MPEIFDIVDENDQIIGQDTRANVHKNKLRHRSVHIFVFNSKGELFIQERALDKDEFPGYWDSSCSGHIDHGEEPDFSAHRELKEELGIETSLRFLNKFPACPESGMEFNYFYVCTYDGELTLQKEEIITGKFLHIDTIKQEIEKGTRKYTGNFVIVFKWWWEHQKL
ncbi:MAG: NUDIX domain-containing protein [Nanoarchaeota archaeon]|nr:NUDIX domain-containing protein [Nanoarchaeota archaeon]